MAMQGDCYQIPIVVRKNAVVIEPQMVELLVLKIGGIAKFYPGGGLTYAEGTWQFPLSQEQSLQLPDRPVETGGRMKLLHEDVVGFRGPDVNIRKAIVEGVI